MYFSYYCRIPIKTILINVRGFQNVASVGEAMVLSFKLEPMLRGDRRARDLILVGKRDRFLH